jgi:serine/threonine-protein kinase
MSPEQATGDQMLGPATDTYALACVLYEMLVGEPPYLGNTAQAVLGKIIQGLPVSATAVRGSIPANVDAAIRKALEKLPADRFTRAKDFATALADQGFRHGELAGAEGGMAAGPWNRLTMATSALAVVFAMAFGWSFLRPAPADPPRPVSRVSVVIPEDQLFNPTRGDLDLSDDGSLMVYRGVGDAGEPLLWARRWNALDATQIRNTEGATYPAISPDGLEVALITSGSVRVIPLQGGVSRTLAEGVLCCTAWSPDGAWLYYSDPNPGGGLWRVPAGGGSPEMVTDVDDESGDQSHVFPDVLPGGSAVVYMVAGLDGERIQAVDVETGEVKDLTPGTYPRYSPTGHLLFMDDDNNLLAAPFDVESLELTGAAVPVAEGLLALANGTGFFAISETGKLVYLTGTAGFANPVWVERDGTVREIDPGWRIQGASNRASIALSPDASRLAVSMLGSEGIVDIWVKQLADAMPLSRLTFEGSENFRATWSPDGQSLMFVSNRAGDYDLWTKRADGSGTAELVLDREGQVWEGLHSSDGTWLIFREGGNQAADIQAIRTEMDSEASPLEVTGFQERSIALSPDGRWLAYVSNRSGRNEVFVRPFPEAGESLQQVSAVGGTAPVWAHSGRELFYMNGASEMVAVQVSTDPTFAAGRQDVLFSVRDYVQAPSYALFDVTTDDQQFVMLRISDEEGEGGRELIWVENWAEELRERMAN